jgi:DNA-binding response OmpR family regulator
LDLSADCAGGEPNLSFGLHEHLPSNQASSEHNERSKGPAVTLRILFLEKDLTTSDLLVPSLERKGHQVTVVQSQRAASASLRSSLPDILIVDMHSFGAKGFRVTDAVRSRAEGVATILLVAPKHKLAGSMADAFMVPPFTSRKLLHRVNKVAQTLTSRELCIGDLSFDPVTRKLRRQSSVVQLRPKEAALLALFMRNPGKVLSRRTLMKEVWETDFLDDTGTLNVHIRYLRKKIETDPSSPQYLRTVRGVGYRFDAPP